MLALPARSFSLNRDGFAALLQAVAHRGANNSSSLAEVAEVAVDYIRQMVLELAVGTTVERGEETEILVPMVVEVELVEAVEVRRQHQMRPSCLGRPA